MKIFGRTICFDIFVIAAIFLLRGIFVLGADDMQLSSLEDESTVAGIGESPDFHFRSTEEYEKTFRDTIAKYAADPERRIEELKKLDRWRLEDLEKQYGDLDEYLETHPVPDSDVEDDSYSVAREIMELREALADETGDSYNFDIGDATESDMDSVAESADKEAQRQASSSAEAIGSVKSLFDGSSSGSFSSGFELTNSEIDRFVSLLGRRKNERQTSTGSISGNADSNSGTVSGDERGSGLSQSGGGRASVISGIGDDDGIVDVEDLPEDASGYFDEATYGSFNWEFGGFNGSGAKESKVIIGGLEMEKNGLRFSYDFDLSSWGVEDPTDASQALACLFVLDNDGRWIGGKFEWISTSRTTREFSNIYNDQDYKFDFSNVPESTTAAFVIVSADGKRRSNVITALWNRK